MRENVNILSNEPFHWKPFATIDVAYSVFYRGSCENIFNVEKNKKWIVSPIDTVLSSDLTIYSSVETCFDYLSDLWIMFALQIAFFYPVVLVSWLVG